MMVNKKGLLAAGAVAVAASLALAGCAGGSTSGSSKSDAASSTLTVWVDADRAAVLKDAAAAFTKESGVKVKLVQKDFGKIQEAFIAQVPTGKGPDITIAAHDWLGNFVSNGVVQPVELGDTVGDYQKVAVTAMSVEGKTYGVPYSIENIALLRNTALAPTAPATYDDMIAAGTAAGTEFPFLVQVGPESDPYHLYPFQTSFGAPVFGTNADGSYNPDDLSIGNAGGEAYAAWLAKEGAAGHLSVNVTGDIAKEKFNSGASPFLITGPWNVPDAQKAGIDVAVDPIPSAGGSPAQPFVGVQGFVVSAKSKNALAANEFLVNYIGSEKVQTELYKVGGRAPALTSAFEAASSDPITAGFGAVAAEAVPMPSIPQMGKVWQFWGVTEAAIITGAGDPTQLWQKMTADIQAAIK
ncbi:maltose ABC transporter substrate-binding protein [Cryobacterium sp. TMT2-10]|uniref:Maltose ABC transporter substrate-binding protein n=1 Tax=Cryobacterium shii TaxID=1259235 RepID=A0AAQ2C6S3_9MICO|nr:MULTISPECIES: maltose ABC transporter substrate-binding protein [Cryobacterium]TFC48631.1 maltose ABC transporter substrate-binding protein [Cryobacterium shii]TFC86620.1 maltose ABC transporter substrate-binding protein [Cryobacterium sp. TmT2-59]TFD15602.1 maltose ABC transporter substrate-binding protein [Cryobacterium sp. TMT4-10]TFD39617.1 maltose ABC transporter substrate-binding protein [Cryobacterium sp. TMT2-10]